MMSKLETVPLFTTDSCEKSGKDSHVPRKRGNSSHPPAGWFRGPGLARHEKGRLSWNSFAVGRSRRLAIDRQQELVETVEPLDLNGMQAGGKMTSPDRSDAVGWWPSLLIRAM